MNAATQKTQFHPNPETAMKSFLTMVAIVMATFTLIAPQIAEAATDPGMIDKVKSNSNFTSFQSAVKPCKPDGTCPTQDAVDEAESSRSGLLRAIRSTVGASSAQEYIGPVLGPWAGVTFRVGSSTPPTDKWCASSQKRIPLADLCPPCPEGSKEAKGKCVEDPKPPPPVCGEHGAKPACKCEGLWSGSTCQDAPIDCGLCAAVKKGETCNVWSAYTQSCVQPTMTTYLAFPAGTHEVKVGDKPACGCDSNEAVIIGFPQTSGDCPWKLWKKVVVGIASLLLLLLLILFVGFLSHLKNDKKGPPPAKVKCLGKDPHDNVAGATKCVTCGAEVPPPPPTATTPAEKGGASINMEELDQRIALALDRDRAAERAQADAMLLVSLVNSSNDHLEGLKVTFEVTTDPTEKAALAQAVQLAEIWHKHMGDMRDDLEKVAKVAIEDQKKK